MNKIYVLPKDELGEELYLRIYLLIKKKRWAWAAIGATFGLAGGMLSIASGTLLWAILPLLAPDTFGSFLKVLETLFFVLSLPLLALGACCLDLLEKRPPIIPLPFETRPIGFENWHRLRPQRPHQN